MNSPFTEEIYNQILNRRRGNSNDGELLQQALLAAFSETAKRTIPVFLAQLLHVRRVARLITSKLVSKESYAALNLKLSFMIILFVFLSGLVFVFLSGLVFVFLAG